MKKTIAYKTLSKAQADREIINHNSDYKSWKESCHNHPKFTEWRQGIPEECLTEEFMQFAQQACKSGLELKNVFSIYSKLAIIAPGFIKQYIECGAQIERPTTGEWNLRKLIEQYYGISESVYRIIEQEKIPNSCGTARSGFEALQAIFVKGCALGQSGDCGDYTINGLHFENKGEAGRVIGQERIFNAELFRAACEQVASKYRTKSFDAALRKAFHASNAPAEVKNILRGIYPDAEESALNDCAAVYMKYLTTIPEVENIPKLKKVCVRRQSKYHDAEYIVKEVTEVKEVPTQYREKEVFRFVAGLMELKYYQQISRFDILDLCENQTGRILSFDCRDIDIIRMADTMWGKARFYNSIGGGPRDGAHQIGFVY